MALHKTQCPHCFTSYVISDAQLRVSEGMVRCGTCRERFQARIIEEIEAPRFDPRDAFIEPLSDESESSISVTVSEIEQQLEPQEIEFLEPLSNQPHDGLELFSEDVYEASEEITEQSTAEITEETSVEASDQTTKQDTQATITPYNFNSQALDAEQMLANIAAKEKRKQSSFESQESTEDLPHQGSSPAIESNAQAQHRFVDNQPEELIDQVDALVDHKLLRMGEASDSQTAMSQDNALENKQISLGQPPTNYTEFDLATTVNKKSWSWLSIPPLLALIGLLIALLGYQLWIKQLINIAETSPLQTKLIELTAPLVTELEERNIALPVRRNLSKMELISARTEPHPTRPSTTLLRVSIANRADISQPLPWLEMSLTDEDGRLVSRRNLSPLDYLYNNNSLSRIGAKELKKITIELLSFPKQATGYELKLLNR